MKTNEWASYYLHCTASFSKERQDNLSHSQSFFHFDLFLITLLFGYCEEKGIPGRGILYKVIETGQNANSLQPMGGWQKIRLERKAGIQSRRPLAHEIEGQRR